MKKGKKYRAISYKIKTVFHSGFVVTAIGFIALSIISFVGIIANLISYFHNTGDKAKDIVAIVISMLSFTASLIGTVRSIKILWRDCFGRQLLEDKEYKLEIVKKITAGNNSDYCNNHYEWDHYRDEYFIHSDQVDKALFERSDQLLLKVSPKKRPMSKDQSEVLYKVVEKKIAQGKVIFNSDLVRLRTDMFINAVLSSDNTIDEVKKRYTKKKCVKNDFIFNDLRYVDVEKTDYFLNLTTNDLIYSRVFKYDYSSIYYGKDMLADSYDNLYNLSQSPAANIIGVNTLAITNDGYLIINRQNRNDVHNDTYVPSGSGSSDFLDLTACRKLENHKVKSKRIGISKRLPTIELQSQPDNLDDIIALYKDNISSLRTNKKKIKRFKFNSFSDLSTDVLQDFTAQKEKFEKILADKNALKNIKNYIKKMKKYTCSFKNFISYGMVRELIEESCIGDPTIIKKNKEIIKKYMGATFICGFIRLLDRGGKPDFFGITRLDLSKDEIEKSFNLYRNRFAQNELLQRCAITDYNEVCSQQLISISEFKKCKNIDDFENVLNEGKDDEHKAKVSLQLAHLFNLLKNETIFHKALEGIEVICK